MALTKAQIDLMYEGVLARHATAAEQAAFSALSNSESTAQIELDIATLPEATSLADPLIRLYQGAFGRTPDAADPNGNFDTGAQSGYWVNLNALRSGVTLLGLAQAFVVSAEFNALYGSTSVTPALITAFYQHILGRDPSSAEVAAWQATGLDAAHILIGFTQSTEFIARSQAAIDAFKVQLANGTPPAPGPLPPPPAQLTLEDDHNGSVNEGQTVTFTLQSTNAADFGKTFSYNISGSVSAADIVGGSLVGSVTLDAQGLAHVAVTLVADATTEGNETLTLNVGALTDTVTVVDTSKTPVIHNFTAVVGETLEGSAAQDTFVGVVDRTFVNDQTTLSNLVDIANGGGGFDTEKVFVLNNFFGTEITPVANSVEIFQVTDRVGSAFDMRFVPQVLEIDEVNSDASTTFNHVQNLVAIGLLSPDANGVNMTVNVADTVANGDVGVTLVNTNTTAANAVDITYRHDNGTDVVTGYTFNVTGANLNVDLNNTTPTTFINVVGNDATATLDLDLQDATGGLNALTSIDASGFAGALTMDDIGQASAIVNNLTMKGAQGNNVINIKDANNATIDVTTFGGKDAVTVTNQGTGKVTVSTGNGNGDAVTVTNGAGNSGDVKVTVGNGNGDKVTVNTSNNVGPGVALVDIAAGTGTGDVINVGLGSFHTLNVKADGLAATVTQTNFAGLTNMIQTITADGGDATITSFSGANSPITIHATGAGVNQTQSGLGSDLLGGKYNQVIDAETSDNTGTSAVKVTTGAGADYVLAFGGFNGTNNITVDTGAGNDFVFMKNQDLGLHTGVSLNGGDGTDTLALTALAAHGGLNGATVTGFEALEITNTLGTLANGGVVVSDFTGGNHVILDAGFTTGADLVGVNSGVELDLFGASAGQTLFVEVTGANIHTNDVVNVDLHNGTGASQNFGNLELSSVETVSITSEGVGTANNTVTISNIFGAQAITTLNIDGDNALTLSGAAGGLNNVTTVNAGSHTGGLTLNLGGDNKDISITTGSGNDNITALGTGDHQISTGDGNDTITTGGGVSTVYAGLGNDTINSQGTTVNNVYKAAAESAFGAGDTINAFLSGTDNIDISAIVNGKAFVFAGNFNAAGTSAQINGDIAGAVTAVYNTTTGQLLIDVNGDHQLTAGADMAITLGVASLQVNDFIV